ncbi:MAG TPA: Gfo/Idh/MocA family oxidoreductase [Solirubrobacterales bacterium]|jgi:predicted dehydrogenase
MTPIRAAVVGLGGIAEEHLVKLHRLQGVEVAGVCDLSQTLVDAVCERYSVGPGFTDYDRMLAETQPDVVHVLAPPATHAALVGAALRAGAHVFAEKPIAPSLAEYERMREEAVARGLLLTENYNYLFMDSTRRGLDLFRSGQLGEAVNLDVSMGVGLGRAAYGDPDIRHFAHDMPGGALRNFASHPASIVTAVLEEWSSLAVSQRQLQAGMPGNDELRALVGDDRVSATLSITTRSQPSQFTWLLRCSEGTLECDVFGQRLQVIAGGSPLSKLSGEVRQGIGRLGAAAAQVGRAATDRHSYFEGFERLLDDFYAAIADGRPSPIPLAQMDATNRLVEEIFEEERQV